MQRFKHILCVLERDEASRLAFDRARALAQSNQAKLTVIEVIPPVPVEFRLPGGDSISGELQTALLRAYQARLQALIEPWRKTLDIQYKILLGTSFIEVIREVLRHGHDLVIKCPESPAWLDRLFAGDDMHLLRKCPCPVWLVKPQAPATYKRIVAAVDVNEFYPAEEMAVRQRLNFQILEMGLSLALSESAELHIVHAWEAMAELVEGLAFAPKMAAEKLRANVEQERRRQQHLLDELVHAVRRKRPVAGAALDYLKPAMHLVRGSARKEVPALADELDADCLVMGTVARTGIRGFIMGNTAETILEQIDCSVLAIKPEGFVTPVRLDG